MTTLKGLNLPPVQAALLTYGYSTSLFQSGKTNHRGKVVLRASMTVPPDNQVLANGMVVSRRSDGTFLSGEEGAIQIPLLNGKIIGSACIVDCVRTRGGYDWIFEKARPTTKRCPRCWANGRFDGAICPTCNGNKRTQPVDVEGAIRRIWFQW